MELGPIEQQVAAGRMVPFQRQLQERPVVFDGQAVQTVQPNQGRLVNDLNHVGPGSAAVRLSPVLVGEIWHLTVAKVRGYSFRLALCEASPRVD